MPSIHIRSEPTVDQAISIKYRYAAGYEAEIAIQTRYNLDTISIQFRYNIDTLTIPFLIQYRYDIDTISIQNRYKVDTNSVLVSISSNNVYSVKRYNIDTFSIQS